MRLHGCNAPQGRASLVVGDAVNPGAELRAPAEGGKAAEGGKKNILRYVFHLISSSQESEKQGEDPALVAVD